MPLIRNRPRFTATFAPPTDFDHSLTGRSGSKTISWRGSPGIQDRRLILRLDAAVSIRALRQENTNYTIPYILNILTNPALLYRRSLQLVPETVFGC